MTQPLQIIEAKPGWRTIDFGEFWKYRGLLYFLTWRDVKVRYKQTVLGALWAILQPVMTMVVFTIFFGRLGGMDRHTDTAYPIFVYAGLLPWQFFASATTQSGQSLISSSNLISKVYFPRLIVPFAAIGSSLVDLAVSFVVILCLMICYGIPLTTNLLVAPLLVLAIVLAAAGVGTLLSALSVAYRDFRYVVPFVIQLWMFASPVAYPLDVVPDTWRLAYSLNPMAGLISAFRSAILGGPFHWELMAVSSLVVAFVFITGAMYFRRVERRFADIV